ncbi:MAG: 4-hydroxy-3-methylbut-2-enyl diphosphate reductase [Actinobacteria bacterium]|nr:MAG: 4-hydroxy-3-methylbut-2-enyl diphosphate reductase [Actinomycetota bacterium]
MDVILAKHAGYCYGVERALKIAKEAIANCPKPIVTLGPIIHNPQVVNWLEELGIHAVDEISEKQKGTVIIRSHGIDPEIVKKFVSQGLEVIDATCPFVKKAQSRAQQLTKEGYSVVIIGERNHPEVIGILAYAQHKAQVIEKVEDIEKLSEKLTKRLGVVVQTTQSKENLGKIVGELSTKAIELKVFNTICNATQKSQADAKDIARKTDVVLVVGGKNSANTSRLAKICKQINSKTYHIETVKEIKKNMLNGVKRVGITAGASTADWILKDILTYVEDLEI